MTDAERPPYEKPDAAPLSDEQADGIVGGGSGAADCVTGDVAFNGCDTGPSASY